MFSNEVDKITASKKTGKKCYKKNCLEKVPTPEDQSFGVLRERERAGQCLPHAIVLICGGISFLVKTQNSTQSILWPYFILTLVIVIKEAGTWKPLREVKREVLKVRKN